jgi:hypothetical protein
MIREQAQPAISQIDREEITRAGNDVAPVICHRLMSVEKS